MSANFIVGPGHEFNYPADAASEQIIKNAGGRSKLKEEERVLVKFKTVVEGQNCSDMPVAVRDLYVSRGWIIVQETPDKSEKSKPVIVKEDE
jgi:hypothetical protein